MKATDQAKVRRELAKLERDGVILPAAVVERARDAKSALHQFFEWDDSIAAEHHRLVQARTLIRCFVVVDEAQPDTSVRAFVALRSDRADGGGYRAIAAVMSDEELHDSLLRDALLDLRSAQTRYRKLGELRGVFREVDRAERAFEKKRGRKVV